MDLPKNHVLISSLGGVAELLVYKQWESQMFVRLPRSILVQREGVDVGVPTALVPRLVSIKACWH